MTELKERGEEGNPRKSEEIKVAQGTQGIIHAT